MQHTVFIVSPLSLRHEARHTGVDFVGEVRSGKQRRGEERNGEAKVVRERSVVCVGDREAYEGGGGGSFAIAADAGFFFFFRFAAAALLGFSRA